MEYFMAADGKTFRTYLMTKEKIGIKFWPYCIVWTRVKWSNLPNKDIFIGMDVYSVAQKLMILSIGIKYKITFKPYSTIMKIYSLSNVPSGYEEIKSKLLKNYADSHGKFLHPKHLWKDETFLSNSQSNSMKIWIQPKILIQEWVHQIIHWLENSATRFSSKVW